MEETSKFRTKIDEYYDASVKKGEHEIKNSKTEISHVTYKSVNFIWSDGKQHAFTYSYLVDVLFEPTDDGNLITADFTSHRVAVKGYKLSPIYEGLINHTVNRIEQNDSRFGENPHSDEPVINEIIVD